MSSQQPSDGKQPETTTKPAELTEEQLAEVAGGGLMEAVNNVLSDLSKLSKQYSDAVKTQG